MSVVALDTGALGRVLLVDDEPAIRKVIERMLEAEGYEVLHAGDGAEALELAWREPVDTIVLDMRMPGMSGLEVCRQLRADPRTEHTPVVFVTGMADRQFRRDALHAGATDFLAKPFDEIELLARLRNSVRIKLYYDGLARERTDLRGAVQRQLAELETASTRLERLQRDLAVARHETIERLARAAEYRDDETAAHLHRMSHYCHLLARKAELDDYACEMLRIASPMHDVGKIGIPDVILHKPGKLNAEEWAIMQTHAALGARIIGAADGSELLEMAASVACTHHERWDGSGYPAGLAGAAIPLEGRIVAVVDVFDALMAERPYKPAWTLEAALNLITREAGRHFDPAIAARFLEIIPEIQAIRARFVG